MSAASKRKKKKKLSTKKRRQALKLQQGREDENQALESIRDELSLQTRDDVFIVDTKAGEVEESPKSEPNYVVVSASNRSAVRKLTKRMLAGEKHVGHKRMTPRSSNSSVWLPDARLLSVSRKRSRSDFQVPNSRKTIELPGHGESYNPAYRPHQDMLGTAAAFKVAKQRHAKRIRDSMKVPKEIQDSSGLDDGATEMKAYLRAVQTGAPLTVDEDDSSGNSSVDDSGDQYELPDPYKPTKRKTKRQRRAAKRKPRISKKKQREKKAMQLTSALALFDQGSDAKERGPSRSQRKADSTRVRRIGKRKYEEKMVEVVLPSDLPGSLRRVDSLAVSNPFARQYASFQARNLIPVTVHHAKQKRNIKYKVKKRRERERIQMLQKKGIL